MKSMIQKRELSQCMQMWRNKGAKRRYDARRRGGWARFLTMFWVSILFVVVANCGPYTQTDMQSSATTSVIGSYQAEHYTSQSGCYVKTKNKGYTGDGYVDYGNNGTWIEWNNVYVATPGEYKLTFRYASASDRRCFMFLNGSSFAHVAFASTGAWTTWRTTSITKTLRAGYNKIRLFANSASTNGGPNLDRMDVIPLVNERVYQAENYSNQSGCYQKTNNEGYTGDGYMDYGNNGTWIEWNNVYADAAQNHTIVFRYASATDRRCLMIVNNTKYRFVSFGATGGWTQWGTTSIDESLQAGYNKIRLIANSTATNGGPNLDSFTVKSSTTVASDVRIDSVFLGQTHVHKPDHEYANLVANRKTLIKAHVVSSDNAEAPAVKAIVNLNGNSLELPLQGPDVLPTDIPTEPGVVQHTYDDSFVGFIPKQWVQPKTRVTIQAADKQVEINNLKLGAPTEVIMTMFDVQYFADTNGDYPAGWKEELEAKWPVSKITLRRLPHVVFEELVIPPRGGVGAARVTSKYDYKQQTGINFDGEQAAALQWKSALKAAAGTGGRVSLYYVNIYGVHAGGQAGGFGGVGNGKSTGILNHELGHALSLPHWAKKADYPYRGDMYGIEAPASDVHVGPTWGFDLATETFLPPTVQPNSVGGTVGTYKQDPMQGGGYGDQEQGFLMRHFSDYSVYKMRSYLESHVAVWNQNLGKWSTWDAQTKSYAKVLNNNGVAYPVERDVQVVSIMAAVSGAKPDVCMVYPPIGPYVAGLIDLFDPRDPNDRTRAQQVFCPSAGCDVSLRITQGSKQKVYMLAIPWEPNANPLSGNSLKTKALNLKAADGTVTRVDLLLTPEAEHTGYPQNPQVLYTWTAN